MKISEHIRYVGVTDHRNILFENQWTLPYGVAYNSYLIVDEKIALIDTAAASFGDDFLDNIREEIGDRKIDFLIINHMEPDHSALISLIRKTYPEITIIGNARTLPMIEGYQGITDNVKAVQEGETLTLGETSVVFKMTPLVHWPETMMTYCPEEKTLFSGDGFGCFGAVKNSEPDHFEDFRDEMVRYYASIVGKYGNPVQRALQKLSALEIKTICSTHGPVWQEHVAKAVGIYDRLSRYEAEEGVVILYGSMYGHTEQMAEVIASALADQGVKRIVMHNVSKTPASYILADVFRYKGIIVGSPTYSNQLFPEVEAVLSKIELREVKNRLFGYFGSFSWAGAAVKRLAAFGEKMKWETVGTPAEQKQGMTAADYAACYALGEAMAEQLKSKA